MTVTVSVTVTVSFPPKFPLTCVIVVGIGIIVRRIFPAPPPSTTIVLGVGESVNLGTEAKELGAGIMIVVVRVLLFCTVCVIVPRGVEEVVISGGAGGGVLDALGEADVVAELGRKEEMLRVVLLAWIRVDELKLEVEVVAELAIFEVRALLLVVGRDDV